MLISRIEQILVRNRVKLAVRLRAIPGRSLYPDKRCHDPFGFTAAEAPGRWLHYYFNYSTSRRRVRYHYAAGAELLSQKVVDPEQILVLQPWGLAVVEERKIANH